MSDSPDGSPSIPSPPERLPDVDRARPAPAAGNPLEPAQHPIMPTDNPIVPAARPTALPRTPEVPLVTIGDITVTRERVITPVGSLPLARAQFAFSDMSRTERVTPAWAIVLAIIGFFFFLLGLLFLLAKEERTTGGVQVLVTGPGFMHTFQTPVNSSAAVRDLAARVNYARSVAATTRPI